MKRKDKSSFIPFSSFLPLLLIAPNSLPGLLCVISQLGHSNLFKYAAACIKNSFENDCRLYCTVEWFHVPAFYDLNFSNSQIASFDFKSVGSSLFTEKLGKFSYRKWLSIFFFILEIAKTTKMAVNDIHPFLFSHDLCSFCSFSSPSYDIAPETRKKDARTTLTYTSTHMSYAVDFDANPFLYFWG